jgi:YidC/Oxa1 family membrane protein insertase
MNYDNKNFILAIVLSMLIIFGWQYFYAQPMLERQQAEQARQQQQQQSELGVAPSAQGEGQGQAGAPVPGTAPGAVVVREQALAATPRLKIDTPTLSGSINLKGAAIDDLHLKLYRETVDPRSPIITLLSPSGTKGAYFAEQGWTPAPGTDTKVPMPDTVWQSTGSQTLSPGVPVTLTWDNGEGLRFNRTITVDDEYMFTVSDVVENTGTAPATLQVYSRVQRQGTPHTDGIWVLYEGPIGVLDDALHEIHYSDVAGAKEPLSYDSTGGWLGFTDKYWAVAAIPDQQMPVAATFHHSKSGDLDIYQTHFYSRDALVVQPGSSISARSQVFAGAKVVQIIEGYFTEFNITKFDLMIDWGWFRPLTKPLFYLLEFLKGLLGNFGLAILGATVLVKLVLFPLANKSYASMSKMKKLQPEMEKLKQLYPDDRMKLQQEMMALYKREKVSPVSGCLPILVQIPIFFALYKVIYTTIELRHAPFFGWIRDLSAGDPTTIFNLFGLIPWSPPHFLMIGVWPIIMGITMWLQMRLNPTPPDPVQAQLFNWMPIIFTFMLGTFPAGLVIYWAWNNTLSILQQAFIMKKHGVEINFFGNIRESLPFLKKKPAGS